MVLPRIVWTRMVPCIPEDPASRFELAGVTAPLEPGRFASAVAQVGVPQVDGASSPKEDAIGLLMLAAEVEHALMVQYLYAAQSVRGVSGRTIAHIAVQEMGHLVTVQNLLLSLEGLGAGGLPARIHLGRDRLRRASSHNPLPLILGPLSHASLAKFIVVERPAEIADAALNARLDVLEAEAIAAGADPNPVYALYAAIRWIFQPDDADPDGRMAALGFRPGWHLRDEDFADSTQTAPFQAEPIEWGAVPGLIVAPVEGRAAALTAIDAIATQGEGAPGSKESHFHDFLGVLDRFEAGDVRPADLPPTPHVTGQPAPEDPAASPISNPYTALWAALFNAVYELLLVDIGWALCSPRHGPARAPMVDVCIDTMGRLIQPMAAHLAKRPLADDPQIKAGPTYGLLREDTPATTASFAERYALVLGERDRLIAQLVAAAEHGTDTGGKLILMTLQEIDQQRAPHRPQGG